MNHTITTSNGFFIRKSGKMYFQQPGKKQLIFKQMLMSELHTK